VPQERPSAALRDTKVAEWLQCPNSATGCHDEGDVRPYFRRSVKLKNQYFGDINDYRKYGLLRALGFVTGLQVGICWTLTPDEGGSDGEFRRYLEEPSLWRKHDPELYDHLRKLLAPGMGRSVEHARCWELIPGATYYERLLSDDLSADATTSRVLGTRSVRARSCSSIQTTVWKFQANEWVQKCRPSTSIGVKLRRPMLLVTQWSFISTSRVWTGRCTPRPWPANFRRASMRHWWTHSELHMSSFS
jgi:hypothetical protein